ncbi:MAG: LON peptidase substrate-binding domain-containing protein [Candidatus Limnocylindria bacterium]
MRLPYFPLHTVLFPHLPLPLHIFEERYRAMARDILADGSPFGGRFVVAMMTDGPEVGGNAAATHIGTVCEVRSAEQLPDGRWVLLAVGLQRARLGPIDRSGAYALVDAEPLDDVPGERADELLPTVQAALDGYMATVKRFVAQAASVAHDSMAVTEVAASLDQVLKPIRLPEDPAAASYAVGGVLQIELSRKQHLLELPDAATRLREELALLRRESRLLADGALPPVSTNDLAYHPN